jgi:hypothetical protein
LSGAFSLHRLQFAPFRARLNRFPGKPAARRISADTALPCIRGIFIRTPFVAQTRSGASGAVKTSTLAARFQESFE